MLTVKIQSLSEDFKLPEKATPGSAGWDLYALTDGTIPGGRRKRIPLGFAIELPDGWTARIKQRSSWFEKHGVITNDSPIDSDYRDELCALVMNTGEWPVHYKAGERIAQLVFEYVPVVRFALAQELSVTSRSGGFGSTGK